MAMEGQGILFAISTRSSGGDMEPLIEACKRGEGPYEFYERIPICEECLLFDSNQQKELCPHMGHVRQAWGDDKRKKTSSQVSKLLDLQGAHAQENLNLVENINRKFFNPNRIDEVFKQENHVNYKHHIPQAVYVGIDPANGGEECFLSGAAFWKYYDRNDVLGGILLIKADDNEYLSESAKHVSNFISLIRKKVPDDVPIIVGVENLPPVYAAMFEAEIRFKMIENIYMVYAGNKGVYNGIGVPCNHGNPDVSSARSTAAKLFDGYSRASKNMIIVCNVNPFPFSSMKSFVLDICSKQLKNLEIDEKGKVTGKSNGQQDDFCSAVIKACQTKYYMLNPEKGRIRNIYDMKEDLVLALTPDVSVKDTIKMDENKSSARKKHKEYNEFVEQRTAVLNNKRKEREDEEDEQQQTKKSKTTHNNSNISSDEGGEGDSMPLNNNIHHSAASTSTTTGITSSGPITPINKNNMISPATGQAWHPVELILRHHERDWAETQMDYERQRKHQDQRLGYYQQRQQQQK